MQERKSVTPGFYPKTGYICVSDWDRALSATGPSIQVYASVGQLLATRPDAKVSGIARLVLQVEKVILKPCEGSR